MKRLSLFMAAGAILVAGAEIQAQTYRSADARRTGVGVAVSVSEGTVAIGWPHWSGFTPMMPPGIPGNVLMFSKGSGGRWTESSRIGAADGTDDNRFGRALALNGNRMVVGATIQDGIGAAYLYERGESGEWTETTRLMPASMEDAQSYGRAAAIAGDFAFVSTVAYGNGAGIVFVFKDQGNGRWTPHSTLQASDADSNSFFGVNIAAEGDLLGVGAPSKARNTGALYVFQYDAGSDRWTEIAMYDGDEQRDRLGASVDVHFGHVVSGAPGMNGNTGAAIIYGPADDGVWAETRRLHAFDGETGDQFGVAVSTNDSELWVGAPFALQGRGTVYVHTFEAASATWTGVSKLTAERVERRDFFGNAISVTNDIAAVSVANDDYGEGSVAIYERSADGSWVQAHRAVAEAAGLTLVAGGMVPCEGGEAAAFDCDQMDLQAFMPVSAIGGARGEQVSDVWGWTDPETGREWALVGRYGGTAFVDITDPTNPVYVGELPLPSEAQWNVWRDIKVYKDHAFIVSDGAGLHGMQVFDLRQLRSVRNAPVSFAATAHYDGIGSAHNIVINEETGFAYAVGVNAAGETCGGGLHMIDIKEPTNPTFVGCFQDTSTGFQRTGYTHDAMCVVYDGPDTEYRGREICFGGNETALSIADVTDKSNPIALSSASYPSVGYAHQGWISEDHEYFYLDDEGDELQGTTNGRTRTLVFDIKDLDDPVLATEFFGTTAASDHNLYIKGNLMYQSNYVAGLRVIDISDPENPKEVGYFDTARGENVAGFAGTWSNYPFFASGTVVVTSGREGLFLVRKKQTLVP